jgi:glycosyltransferase involved in cell wall biosynthesis
MLLSILICNYNYGAYIDQAIRSAVEQAYQPTEVIVIDDGSTDGSREVIERWSGKVQAIFQANQGQIAAYNRGFAAARGDVIIFLDSDDCLDSDLGERVMIAARDPAVVKVHYRLRLIDAHGRVLGPTIPRTLASGDVSERLRNHGIFYQSSPGSGNAYKRSALARLMPLPESTADRHGADFFAALGIALLGEVATLGPAPLASYRIHSKSATEGMLFGNTGLREPQKTPGRYARLRQWVPMRLGPSYQLPLEPIDFSIEKQTFSRVVFEGGYWKGLWEGTDVVRKTLLRSIWLRPTSLRERLGLTGWALGVLVLPRRVGVPIARYVCNPASRAE